MVRRASNHGRVCVEESHLQSCLWVLKSLPGPLSPPHVFAFLKWPHKQRHLGNAMSPIPAATPEHRDCPFYSLVPSWVSLASTVPAVVRAHSLPSCHWVLPPSLSGGDWRYGGSRAQGYGFHAEVRADSPNPPKLFYYLEGKSLESTCAYVCWHVPLLRTRPGLREFITSKWKRWDLNSHLTTNPGLSPPSVLHKPSQDRWRGHLSG